MQNLTQHLAFLLGARKQFKIKFRQYDGGEHVFYPHYALSEARIQMGDIVAWLWGGSLKFGVVDAIKQDNLMVKLLTRKDSSKVHTAFHKNQLICIFEPDS